MYAHSMYLCSIYDFTQNKEACEFNLQSKQDQINKLQAEALINTIK